MEQPATLHKACQVDFYETGLLLQTVIQDYAACVNKAAWRTCVVGKTCRVCYKCHARAKNFGLGLANCTAYK